MNKLIIFVLGAATGAFAGFFAGYAKATKDAGAVLEEDYIPEEYLRGEHSEHKRDDGPRDRKKLDEIKEKLTNNWNGTTNYAAAYDLSKVSDVDIDEDPSIVEIPSETTPDDNLGDVDIETEDFLEKFEGFKPAVIDQSAIGELPPGIDHQCLFYYQFDDTLTTEEDEVIEDQERFLGETLVDSSFCNNDDEFIFVINYDLAVIYEIQKRKTSYHS